MLREHVELMVAGQEQSLTVDVSTDVNTVFTCYILYYGLAVASHMYGRISRWQPIMYGRISRWRISDAKFTATYVGMVVE